MIATTCEAKRATEIRLSEIRLSVALVTRNRVGSLRLTLRSLQQQETPPYEVIVSDDSDNESAAQTQELVQEFGFVYLRGPQRGLYANRNHVALACKGTHIRTMDDDHEFPPIILRFACGPLPAIPKPCG